MFRPGNASEQLMSNRSFLTLNLKPVEVVVLTVGKIPAMKYAGAIPAELDFWENMAKLINSFFTWNLALGSRLQTCQSHWLAASTNDYQQHDKKK